MGGGKGGGGRRVEKEGRENGRREGMSGEEIRCSKKGTPACTIISQMSAHS